MTLFDQVKECVTARQAAEHYGIKVKEMEWRVVRFIKTDTQV